MQAAVALEEQLTTSQNYNDRPDYLHTSDLFVQFLGFTCLARSGPFCLSKNSFPPQFRHVFGVRNYCLARFRPVDDKYVQQIIQESYSLNNLFVQCQWPDLFVCLFDLFEECRRLGHLSVCLVRVASFICLFVLALLKE